MLPDGFTVEKKIPEGFVVDSAPKDRAIPEGFVVDRKLQEEAPFMAKHPTTYGIYGAVKETTKALIPYVKYIDPSERKRFMELSQQKQTRELLLQNLETVAMLGVGPIAKGAWGKFAEHLPKTASKLTGIAKARLWGKKPTLQQAAKARQAAIDKIMPDDSTPVGKLRDIYEGTTAKVASLKSGEVPPPTRYSVFEGVKEKGGLPPGIRQVAARAEPEATTAVQKVVSALKEAKPIRKKQEAIYTATRGEKLARSLKAGEKTVGEKGYYEELRALKGEMPKVQFESIRGKVGQQDIDALFVQVKNNPILSEWEKLTARKGLAKLFGEHGGAVPTEGELSLLKDVFGSGFVKTSLSKRTLFQKLKGAGLELANIPRSLMASFDLSAPLRQGVFLVGRPKQWVPAFGKQFHYFVSEKAYQNLGKTIRAKPTFPLMQEHKLALTELGTKLGAREEAFMSSWAEKNTPGGKGDKGILKGLYGVFESIKGKCF